MKSKSLFLIITSIITANCFYSQDILFVKDSLNIKPGLELYVKGGIKFENDAVLENNGSIFLQTDTILGGENWTNNVSPNSFSGFGKVVFMSSEQQTILGTDTSVFYDLEINNSSTGGITLENSIIVKDRLFLFNGIISTDTNRVIIENTDSSSISGYQLGMTTPSFINGNLRRFVNSSNKSYVFPIGKNGVYYLHRFKIYSITGSINYFDSYFDTLDDHVDADLNIIEDGKPYYSVCTEGVWYLIPDQQPDSILYDYWAYIGNFTNCDLDNNYFAVLKRPDSSLTAADWNCNNCGIGNGLNPDNGDGRILSDGYALRKKLSSFSQYGIGKMSCILNINLGNDTTLCHNEMLVLSADSGYTYLWNTGSTDQQIIVDTTGIYYVSESDSMGCAGNDTISVITLPENYTSSYISICEGDSILLGGYWQNIPGTFYDSLYSVFGCDSLIITELSVNESPDINLIGDTTITIGNYSTLEANDGHTYSWSNGENTQEIIVYPEQTTIYTVTVTNIYNCYSTDSITVFVTDLAEIFIPNAITPNGDGKNDYFFIRGLENYPENYIVIYNRWGNIIFETSSYLNNWKGESQINGEPLPNGTYFYILKLNDDKNTNYTGYIELVK